MLWHSVFPQLELTGMLETVEFSVPIGEDKALPKHPVEALIASDIPV